ncbi:MAG: TonB-dependent receptor [Bacteroidota bacterium]
MKYIFLVFFIYFGGFLVNAQDNISLLDTVELEEIVVKAVRADKKAPFAQTIVDKKDIEQRNLAQDIPILLNYLPSVVTTSDAGAGVGYTGIRVRGSDATRVNITINGIAFNDSESQGTYWVDLPDFASSVENLQLQRGVGTSTNGSGAFGASLNFLTDFVSENAFGEISSSFGSYNTFKNNIKFSTGLLNDHIEIAGRLSVISSNGYIDRATSDLKSYFLQAAYNDENTLIKALSFGGHEITYQAWYGIDEETLKTDRTFNFAGIYTDDDGNVQFYDNEVDNYKQDHYQLHWNQIFSDHWTSNIGLNYTHGKGYYEQYKEDQDFTDYDFTPIEIGEETINTTDLIRRRWLDNDYYVFNANANYKNDKIDIIFGSSYSFYDGDHYGEVIWAQYAGGSNIRDQYYSGNSQKNDLSLFAKVTYQLNSNWSLFGDLQERFVSYQTSGLTSDRIPIDIDENYSFFNPKFGITYTINKQQNLYTSYARANKEPNRVDFENGVFQPETLNDFELGWRLNTGKIKINTNAYFMNYRNQLVLTGKIDDVGNPIRTTSGESYRMGIEIDANFIISNHWSVKPNIALSSNKNKDFIASIDGDLVALGKTNISYSPNFIAGNIISYHPIDNLQFNFLSKYIGEQFMGNIDSEASKLDSYFVNDLNISYVLNNIPIFKSVVFNGLINNIFNKKYVSNGYFYTYDDTWSVPGETITIEGAGYYPQAEINFLLGVTLRF